jgi:molybdopterin molybdotransferase
MLTVLSNANCLLLRPIGDPAKSANDRVTIYPI